MLPDDTSLHAPPATPFAAIQPSRSAVGRMPAPPPPRRPLMVASRPAFGALRQPRV